MASLVYCCVELLILAMPEQNYLLIEGTLNVSSMLLAFIEKSFILRRPVRPQPAAGLVNEMGRTLMD